MSRHYPQDSLSAHPPYYYEMYRASHRRSPNQPLIVLPHSLSELTGPVYGHETITARDSDLTSQHAGEPIGERIIVHGRVLDEDGRPIPNALIEMWQANAAGRYVHVMDDHAAPLDPNFTGAGRVVTDQNGYYRFTTIKPGAYPVLELDNVWRPAHIHFSLFGPSFLSRLVTQMYFPGDPLLKYDMMYNAVPDDRARLRMISELDMDNTQSEWALAFNWNIVLRGRQATHFEEPHDD